MSASPTRRTLLRACRLLVFLVLSVATAGEAPAASGGPGAAGGNEPAAIATPAEPERAIGTDELISALTDSERRKAARSELLARGEAITEPFLARRKDPEFNVRWEFANVMGELRDPRAIEALVERVVSDESPHVRWRSIWALGQYPDALRPRILELLEGRLTASDPEVRWCAAVGLSGLGDDRALAVLHDGLQSADAWKRWEAVNALGRVHDGNSASRIVAAWEGLGRRERREAALSLGRIGSDDALDALEDMLDDQESGVRWRAALMLGRSGAKSAVEPLKARRDVEREADVREKIDEALTALGAPPAGERTADGDATAPERGD